MSFAMVADHQRQMAGQLSSLMTIEQVNQAMLIAGNEDCDRRPLMANHHLPSELILGCQWGEGDGKRLLVKIEVLQRPFNAHEKQTQPVIPMLIRMLDISAMFQDEAPNGDD